MVSDKKEGLVVEWNGLWQKGRVANSKEGLVTKFNGEMKCKWKNEGLVTLGVMLWPFRKPTLKWVAT